MHVIGVHGKAFSGKGVVAKELLDELHRRERGNLYVKKRAFATFIKKILTDTLGVNPVYLERSNLKEFPLKDFRGRSGRDLMIEVGSFFMEMDRNVWVKSLERSCEMDKIYADLSGEELVLIVEDLRMPHELEWIQDHNHTLIKVVRSKGPLSKRDGHETEETLETRWHHVIWNDDLKETRQFVRERVVPDVLRRIDGNIGGTGRADREEV